MLSSVVYRVIGTYLIFIGVFDYVDFYWGAYDVIITYLSCIGVSD